MLCLVSIGELSVGIRSRLVFDQRPFSIGVIIRLIFFENLEAQYRQEQKSQRILASNARNSDSPSPYHDNAILSGLPWTVQGYWKRNHSRLPKVDNPCFLVTRSLSEMLF